MELKPMKTALKVLLAVSVLSAVAAPAFAQSSATTNETTALTIITPIAITGTSPMNFGSVSVGATGGTLELSILGALTPGTGVLITGGTPTAAGFNVTGQSGQAFGVTLSNSDLTATSGGGVAIHLTGLNKSSTTTVGATGTAFTVGGTLTLAAGQAAGTYAGTVTAIVTYQ